MKILLKQCSPRVGDIAANTKLILDALYEAESSQCDFIVFPELTITGYPPEDLLFRPAFMREVNEAVERVVKASTSSCVVFGAPRNNGKSLRNSVILCQQGRVIGQYDKVCLPNHGVFDERRYFEPGDSDALFVVNGYRVGIGICEDLWHDNWADKLSGYACDVWLNLNASPFHENKQEVRERLTARRARQFQAPLVYLNAVGGQDEVVFDGGSHVMTAEGTLMVRLPMFETSSFVLELPQAEKNIAPLAESIAQIHDALVMGIRDYVLRNACQQVVLGLSGGIDSAVTAALAVEALGSENVLGVLLPSQYSSDHSVQDALSLADSLSIQTITLPISESVLSVEQTLSETFNRWGKSTADVTEENIQARIRGVLLMAVSNKTGRMLLTTGNKSEMAVGYATLYGDMAGGFAVLKDVYKTQVYALTRYMNRKREIIPKNTIDKPPSAELRPDQKDSDSLPDYDVLDAILQAMIEQRLGVEAIVELGFDKDVVARVMRLLQASEYKRRQSPPGVKITERAFGRDRRYPITHAFWK